MSDPIRHQIVAAIADTDDKTLKIVLMLMLGVLDEIGTEIRLMRSDEQGLRDAVLNGHSSVHDEHHVWIADRMKSDCSTACEWARGKMTSEHEAAIEAKADKRIARDALIRQVVTIVVSVVSGALMMMWGLGLVVK